MIDEDSGAMMHTESQPVSEVFSSDSLLCWKTQDGIIVEVMGDGRIVHRGQELETSGDIRAAMIDMAEVSQTVQNQWAAHGKAFGESQPAKDVEAAIDPRIVEARKAVDEAVDRCFNDGFGTSGDLEDPLFDERAVYDTVLAEKDAELETMTAYRDRYVNLMNREFERAKTAEAKVQELRQQVQAMREAIRIEHVLKEPYDEDSGAMIHTDTQPVAEESRFGEMTRKSRESSGHSNVAMAASMSKTFGESQPAKDVDRVSESWAEKLLLENQTLRKQLEAPLPEDVTLALDMADAMLDDGNASTSAMGRTYVTKMREVIVRLSRPVALPEVEDALKKLWHLALMDADDSLELDEREEDGLSGYADRLEATIREALHTRKIDLRDHPDVQARYERWSNAIAEGKTLEEANKAMDANVGQTDFEVVLAERDALTERVKVLEDAVQQYVEAFKEPSTEMLSVEGLIAALQKDTEKVAENITETITETVAEDAQERVTVLEGLVRALWEIPVDDLTDEITDEIRRTLNPNKEG